MCGHRNKLGLLCGRCRADAPEAIRRAFELAVGVDGMRKATELVRSYAQSLNERWAA